jgi:hypothetical protein
MERKMDESEMAKTSSPTAAGTPLDTVLAKLDALNARPDAYDEAEAEKEREKAKADQAKEEEGLRKEVVTGRGDQDQGEFARGGPFESTRQDARSDADIQGWKPNDQRGWLR